MMHIEWLKLASDILLLISLAFLGMRFTRTGSGLSQSGRLMELENTLRGLLQEAEGCSRGLNDQLMKRQKDLEKLLFDVETVESRVNRSISTSEERKGSLEQSCSKAYSILNQLNSTTVTLEREATAAQQRRAVPVAQQIEVADEEEEVFRQTAYTPRRTAPQPEPPSFGGAPREEQVRRHIPLAAQIEREASEGFDRELDSTELVEVSRTDLEFSPKQPVTEVLRAAQRAVRTGKSLAEQAVQARPATSAPPSAKEILEQLKNRKLARKLQEERESEDAGARPIGESADPRLGVLGGGIKRQVQIL